MGPLGIISINIYSKDLLFIPYTVLLAISIKANATNDALRPQRSAITMLRESVQSDSRSFSYKPYQSLVGIDMLTPPPNSIKFSKSAVRNVQELNKIATSQIIELPH
jgi:hypothetical protein